MTAPRMTTAELRRLASLWSVGKLDRWIASTRKTMRQPTYYGEHLVGGQQGPDRIFCARSIAVMRAEKRRRKGQPRFTRRAPGSYVLDGTDWTVQRLERAESQPGYRWIAQHPDKGEFYRDTMAEAFKLVLGMEG